MTAPIRVYTLGRLLVERDGKVLDGFISTKAVLLFVYLALHPGQHSRKKLAVMLWSETSDEQALKNLRTILSSIRQQVGDAVIVTHEELAINSSVPLEVDASAFEQGFKTVFSSPGTLDTLKSLQALAALYQGDFLQNIAIRDAAPLDEWVSDKQRQLREVYGHLLFEIVAIAGKRGDYEVGLQYVWDLIGFDPFRDAAQRQLMRLLAFSDRTAEALVQYERFAQRLEEELDTEPEAGTTALYEQLRAHSLNPPAPSGLSSLALANVAYVEPAEDIEIAQRMLNTPHCRLLTLFGISGIGKTALAAQLAFHRQHLYRDGACFVSLGIAQSSRDLLHQVASALNVGFSASMDHQTLENAIIEDLKRRELLLVLDNYEQLLPETQFVQRVLDEVTSVQVIVTSHTPLSLYREWLLPLRGLRVPALDAADPQAYEAVRLFELTAQRVNPRFDLQRSVADIIRICQLVDSLPLGIVIAAGWVQYMPPADILAMMQRDLLQVEAVHHDIPARHRSFQGLLNAMLVHLSPLEQQAMLCLSIFDGSFSFKAALAIAGITPMDFKGLTDKCLVQSIEGFRYSIHSIVRQSFRARLLSASKTLQTVAARYVNYFQHWCDDIYAQVIPLHEIMHTVDVEQHNLWHVPGLSETDRQRFILHIAPALTEYWINRGYHARGIVPLLQQSCDNPAISPETRIRGLITLARILERTSQYVAAAAACRQVLALDESLNLPEFRGRALRVLSEICVRQGDYARADEYLYAIIALASQNSIATNGQLQRLVSLAYEDLGEMRMAQGDYESAVRYIEIAITHWVERGEVLREAIARSYLGTIALKRGELVQAQSIFEEILIKAQLANNHTLIAIFTAHLGRVALESGDYARAYARCHDALRVAIQIDRRITIIQLIEQFSLLALRLDLPEASAQLLGAALAMRDRLNIPVTPHNRTEAAHHQQMLQARLGDRYERTLISGQDISLTAVMQVASQLSGRARSAPPVESLS
jgi:DNA-binding SARP family transcriptional activator